MDTDNRKTVRDKGDLLVSPLFRNLLLSAGFIKGLQFVSLVLVIIAIFRGFSSPGVDNLYTTGLFWGLFWPFFIFITTPVFGKVICGICPYRLINYLFEKKRAKFKKAPKWMSSGYVSLILVIFLYWLPVYTWPGIFHSPLNTSLYFLSFLFLALLATFIYGPSLWCRGLCPVAIPTNIVSRVALFGIRTYRSKCDTCRKPTCFTGREGFEGCPHGINPSKMTNNSDCTLCMKCVDACSHDAVRFGFLKPASDFLSHRFRPDKAEALGVLLLFGALTLTMQFYNGIYRGAMKERFPLYKAASAVYPFLEAAVSLDGLVGFMTLACCMGFSYGFFSLFSRYAAYATGSEKGYVFESFAWTILPVFAFSSLAQMSEFFFFRYYPMTVNGFMELFGSNLRVSPLLSMSSPYLMFFKLLSFAGGIWSIVFVWKQSGKLSKGIFTRINVSMPFWVFHIFIILGFVAHLFVMLFMDIPQVTGPRG